MSNELKRDYEIFLRKLIDGAKYIPYFTRRTILELEVCLEEFRKRHLSADIHKNRTISFLIEEIDRQSADDVKYLACTLLKAESF